MISMQKMLALLLSLMVFDDNKVNALAQFKILKVQSKTCKTEKVNRTEDLEYPRRDCSILQVLYQMWGNYYACLQEKENQETQPEIRRLLEGQNTELKCDYCERPFQNPEDIQWKFKPLSKKINITELQYLDLTPEMSLTRNTLQIYNAVKSFAGLYACFNGKTVISIYILEVSKNDTVVEVKNINSNVEKINKLGHEYYVRYHWTNFTECSTCGKVGKKYKYGVCYVSLPTDYKESYPSTVNHRRTLRSFKDFVRSKVTSFWNAEPLKKDNNLTSKVHYKSTGPEVIKRFRNGIPCRSPYLKKAGYDAFNNFPGVKVLAQYCWEACEEEKIFEVIDYRGQIVEIANNSEGIYSLFQKLPNVPLGVERSTVVAQFGSDIIIHCPGTARTNTPVTWMANNKIIHPQVLNSVSNGRFTVDFTQRIHVKRLRLKDSKIYSCWQKERLVGTVHLIVEKKFVNGYNHHITLVLIAAIIGVLLFLGTKILTKELQMRKK